MTTFSSRTPEAPSLTPVTKHVTYSDDFDPAVLTGVDQSCDESRRPRGFVDCKLGRSVVTEQFCL